MVRADFTFARPPVSLHERPTHTTSRVLRFKHTTWRVSNGQFGISFICRSGPEDVLWTYSKARIRPEAGSSVGDVCAT